MPLNLRTIGGSGDAPAHTYPISRAFAAVILAAFLLLVLLRHFFGNVSVNIGTR